LDMGSTIHREVPVRCTVLSTALYVLHMSCPGDNLLLQYAEYLSLAVTTVTGYNVMIFTWY
jgi:hypothetical protein